MSRRPVRVRLIAGLLACAWALLPLGTLVDALVTEHVYCAEHNAIEHAADPPALTALAAAEPGEHGGLLAADASPREHGDSCPFTQLPPRVLRAPQIVAVAAAPLALAAEPSAIACDAPTLPILAFAPKSSPPA